MPDERKSSGNKAADLANWMERFSERMNRGSGNRLVDGLLAYPKAVLGFAAKLTEKWLRENFVMPEKQPEAAPQRRKPVTSSAPQYQGTGIHPLVAQPVVNPNQQQR